MAPVGQRGDVQFMSIDFDPEPIILAGQFMKFGMDIRSFREPLERSVRQVMVPSLRANFDAGGRPPWQPLATLTVLAKVDKGAAEPMSPLILSGKLRRVAGQINLWSINGPEGEASISQEKLGDVWYGVIHQVGAQTPTGNIPAREWALFQDEDMDKIEEIFWDWIGERALRSGVVTSLGDAMGGAIGE